jgi:L-aspartate oxidase
LALGREGGHHARRIAHVDDTTGQAVIAALQAQVLKRDNITLLEHTIAVNAQVIGERCNGVYALHLLSGKVKTIGAGATVLATGGAGKVYLYATTPQDTTGDGVAIAFRAGCRVRNMEFVQFHPTCLNHPLSSSFLITEAMRGEGALLVNERGERFMLAHHPDAELAPRDIVARTIDFEMKSSGTDCVYLDLSTWPADFWQRRFPTIMRNCKALGLEAASNTKALRIPVVPAAHYCCGGVHTDLLGRTDIAGLWAVGETACTGLHGANRLASNSLLECVVTARRAAAVVADELPVTTVALSPWDERRISAPRERVMVAHNWEELRRTMWDYVGIVRNDERLSRARRRIEWIREEIEDYYRRYVVSRDFLELRNLAQCAELIIEGALSRRESRGLHYNADCPHEAEQATDTLLLQQDFVRRRQAVNDFCPFSGRFIVANALTDYVGHVVGFCNPSCRDDFARAIVVDFSGVSEKILTAKEFFDERIAARR